MVAFSEAEYRMRLGRARDALKNNGMDGAVCVAPETLTYLTGYNGHTYWTDQALIIAVDDEEPTLMLRDVDIPLADESTWVADVRSYHFGRDDPGRIVNGIVREKGFESGVVGLEKQTYALPAAYAERIASQLGESARLVDASRLLSRVRVVKSDVELECVRRAGGMARAGMEAGLEVLKPGITEIELAAEIERALRTAGSEYSSMPTIVGSGFRSAAMHATPTERAIQDGEAVLFYFAGVHQRYHVTAYRTVHVGRPSSRFLDFYAAGERALDVLVESVVVGRPVSDAARAASSSLKPGGHDRYHVARWGYGVGIAYPPVWLEAFDVIEESDDTFQAGTVMCLHACFSVPDEKFGVMVGRDYILTAEGVEALDTTAAGLRII